MIRFLLSLLTEPEDQKDPYVWAAVFGSHMALAVVGWVFFFWATNHSMEWSVFGSIAFYLAFEIVQAILSRKPPLVWDSAVDLTAWGLMVLVAASLWANNLAEAAIYSVFCLITLFVGVVIHIHDEGKNGNS